MLIIDLKGKVTTPSYELDYLHKEAKKKGLENFKEEPFPHYKVEKKNIKKILGKNKVERARPEKIRFWGKRFTNAK